MLNLPLNFTICPAIAVRGIIVYLIKKIFKKYIEQYLNKQIKFNKDNFISYINI